MQVDDGVKPAAERLLAGLVVKQVLVRQRTQAAAGEGELQYGFLRDASRTNARQSLVAPEGKEHYTADGEYYQDDIEDVSHPPSIPGNA